LQRRIQLLAWLDKFRISVFKDAGLSVSSSSLISACASRAWRISLSATFAATFLVIALQAAPAHAQATRTWVSGVGDDANPCSRTAPCKTFAGAISKTAPSGEIDCLDPGGFGGHDHEVDHDRLRWDVWLGSGRAHQRH
jgi:hypothetical protein